MTERLDSYGAKVYAVSLEALTDLKRKCPNVEILSMDLSSWSNVKMKLPEFVKDVQLDGLINNAGITLLKQFEKFTEDDYDRYV